MSALASQPAVMAGLVPAIHVFARKIDRENVDARHEAGHDGPEGAAP
jgi:hypothetical protein